MASPRNDGPSPSVSLDASDNNPSTNLSTTSSIPASLSTPSTSSDPSRTIRRGKITQIACVACRQRKSKCDGARPVCQACQSRPNIQCVYDVTVDQRKPSSLRQRVGELEQEVINFRDILELLLQALPERLRPRFQGFVEHVQEGGLSIGLLDEAKRRLRTPITPDEKSRQSLDDSSRTEEPGKSSQIGDSSGNTAPISRQSASGGPFYFQDASSRLRTQARIEGSWLETLSEPNFAAQSSGNDAGTQAPQWQMQGVDVPSWADMSAQAMDTIGIGTQSLVQDLPDLVGRESSWRANADPPTRSLRIYGKLESHGAGSREAGVQLNTTIPLYIVQPPNEDDPRPLSGMYSGVFVGYRDSKRQLIEGGATMEEVLGSPMINFKAAIESQQYHNDLPLSTWASALLGNHRNLRPSDRVACAWMVTSLMKWQISPTSDHYEQMPPWLRPTPTQCFVPHAANIDYLPWPQIRDALLGIRQEGADVTVNALSVNWPYSDEEMLHSGNNNTHLTLSTTFEAHISLLSNWSLASSVIDTIPALQGLAPADRFR